MNKKPSQMEKEYESHKKRAREYARGKGKLNVNARMEMFREQGYEKARKESTKLLTKFGGWIIINQPSQDAILEELIKIKKILKVGGKRNE